MPEDIVPPAPTAITDEVWNEIENRLVPLMRMIGERFDQIEEVVTKMVCGMYDGVQSFKRSQLADELSSKYADDISPLDDFFKDTQGGSFSDQLIDTLMNGEIPDDGRDEFIKGQIGSAREKFGKYLPQKTTEISVSTAPIEENKEPEKEPMPNEEEAGPEDIPAKMARLLAGKK